jgi:TRAP-type C4-dicarboxylate transport system permease small subunit
MTEPARPADARSAIQRVARAIESAVAFLSKVALTLSGLTTLSIFALICYAVILRYFFNRPQPWTDEAAGWLLVTSVMLALPEVQRRGDHIGIDFLAGRLSDTGRRLLLAFGLVMVLICAVILVVEGIEMIEFSRMLGVLSNQIPEIPLWMVQALVPAGFILLLVVALTQLFCVAVGLRPRDMADVVRGEPA